VLSYLANGLNAEINYLILIFSKVSNHLLLVRHYYVIETLFNA